MMHMWVFVIIFNIKGNLCGSILYLIVKKKKRKVYLTLCEGVSLWPWGGNKKKKVQGDDSYLTA